MEIKKFNQYNESSESQLEIGIKIESEHSRIYDELEEWLEENYKEYASMPWSREEFYKKIAQDHLNEIPDYYDRLVKMEKRAEG